MRNCFKVSLILIFFLSISAYVNLRSPNIPDPDSLYHIRHAWIYQTNSIFDSSFPWTQFSVIKTMGADLWYGFHILLVPLTYLSDLVIAIKVASIVITFLVLASIYGALKNVDVKLPALWAIFFLFSSPSVITRMTMMRPHPLSLALTALIFSLFYKGPTILILIASFLLSWIHSSIFWFPITAICVLTFFKWLNHQGIDARKLTAFFAGIVMGLAARPHPVANLKLIYIQVVDLYLSKNYELAKIIGAELRPPTWEGVYTQKWLFIVLVAALVYLGWRNYKKGFSDSDRKIVVLSSLTLVALSILMYSTAKRAIDQLGLFIITFAGSIFSATSFLKRRTESVKEGFVLILLLSLLLGFSIYNITRIDSSSFHSSTKFKKSALWLEENTEKEDTVFYLNWGYFSFLFFWNQSNYYINGMDPVFLLKYDKKLYWKLYNMAVNEDDKKLYWKLGNMALSEMGGITCGYDPKQCGPENVETVPDVLRNDFHASYVFVEINKQRFSSYMEEDKKNFEKVYENEEENTIIFKVL